MRSLSLTLQILFTLGICLSAFLGCGSGGASCPPPEFRWRGPTTHFFDTAPPRPRENEDYR